MEFVCNDPEASVRAANVPVTLDAFRLVLPLVQRIVARHRLEARRLTPADFVPVQCWLDALQGTSLRPRRASAGAGRFATEGASA